MKSLLLVCLLSLFMPTHEGWKTDFELAKTEATESNKYILLNFSGSDWCRPCMQMKRNIFEDASFVKFASEKLILVNADFPRSKKNQLDRSIQKQNEQLAETYKVEMLPLTILLDASGKELKRWEGSYDGSVDSFVRSLKNRLD
jgi:thioredoxin-related protein